MLMAAANARLRVLLHSKVFARLTRLQHVLMAAPKDEIDGELDTCTGRPERVAQARSRLLSMSSFRTLALADHSRT